MKPKNGSNWVIGVTGLHRGESPQPGGAVVEALRSRFPDGRFVSFSYDSMESGIYSQGMDRVSATYLFSFPIAGPEALLKRIREVDEIEGLDLIIPTLDSELYNYIEIRSELEKMGIQVVVPQRDSLLAREKPNLDALAQKVKVPVPLTYAAADIETLAGYALQLGYPCYVKGALYDAEFARNEKELRKAFADIFAVWGAPILVQKAIYGEEYGVAAIGDGKGGVVCTCMIRKLLKSKMGKGYGGVVVDDPALDQIVHNIIGELKWEGPLEIEFVKPRNQPHFLFEINPRFPAWISFPAQLGCNMPAFVAERAFGMTPKPLTRIPAGKMFIRHVQDLVLDIGDVAKCQIDGKFESEAVYESETTQQVFKPQVVS